ncbi:translation initiation factor IF-2-like [Phocoena sinus]|uniref:translation initiation factor IF-2-like n=1 Tax=Phocoena sinus TaxID=42100 RepID=UPI0013C4220E|nr:translation initiation factor IF-2-like [Phocoena sinus]
MAVPLSPPAPRRPAPRCRSRRVPDKLKPVELQAWAPDSRGCARTPNTAAALGLPDPRLPRGARPEEERPRPGRQPRGAGRRPLPRACASYTSGAGAARGLTRWRPPLQPSMPGTPASRKGLLWPPRALGDAPQLGVVLRRLWRKDLAGPCGPRRRFGDFGSEACVSDAQRFNLGAWCTERCWAHPVFLVPQQPYSGHCCLAWTRGLNS